MERESGGMPGQFGSAGEAKELGQQLAQQAREQVGELANRGGEQLKSQLETQKHQAAQRMTPVQMALRETAQQLRKQGQGSTARYADQAADQVERFSRYLRETDVDHMTDEVRGFARRRPALFLGSAAALGFFASRFLKSSSQHGGSVSVEGDAMATPTATSGASVTYRTGEPSTVLPPGPVEGSPKTRRTPMAGQPLSERGRAEPPRGS